MNYDCDASAT